MASPLPLAPGERVLRTGECRAGCRLAVTRHGFWEHPRGARPGRFCWTEILAVRVTSGHLAVVSPAAPTVRCEHVLDPADRFPLILREMEGASRRVDVSVTLSSGRAARLRARYCDFESVLVWSATLAPPVGSPDDDDRAEAHEYLAAARQEHGVVNGHWWERWY